ncbi:ammonium transporter [Halosegnis rubeus]|jgi:Amt family ammonium transporter|uniref:Ammonium transporter n=1 Tax=Halosegnis rubeus TaxID=2212850 RepID=A0A5N5UCN5_9EURY|nr:ammonium transporter [Halosegnis rubeus]KAB7515324.1 ammonium transporter [Halosegnis rubeus]KAB7516378.1 ammonium transporter [Halosegnis rubeus]KAB7517634.1 ammonium transporter [Halosegnis rubeus]
MSVALPLQAGIEAISSGVNYVWILVVCFLIFFMQPGFALLEAGQVRAKNVGNVLMKNMTDWVVGVLVFFIFGAAFSAMIGQLTTPGLAFDPAGAFGYITDPGAAGWIDWFFGAVFAMTAATIVSGAVAERMNFTAYVFVAVAMTAVIYPAMPGIAWGGTGLLSSNGFIGDALGVGYFDFAGATVVHMCGGLAGLVGAKMVGARAGRFDSNGDSQAIPGHSMLLAVLGTLFLAFGWYGFNVGTQATVLTAEGEFMGAALGRVVLNTTLGMGAGGVAAMVVSAAWQGKPDPLWTANGLLAGLVAVTGAVPHVTWWGGILLGLIAGALVLPTFRWVVDSLKIDDVCGVFVVHGSSGAIGTILIPVFAAPGVLSAGVGTHLAMQVIGVAVIGIWTVLASIVVFGIADALFGLRVSDAEEEEGLDSSEHGISAYPEFVGDSGAGSRSSGAVSADGGRVETDGGVATDGGDNE